MKNWFSIRNDPFGTPRRNHPLAHTTMKKNFPLMVENYLNMTKPINLSKKLILLTGENIKPFMSIMKLEN